MRGTWGSITVVVLGSALAGCVAHAPGTLINPQTEIYYKAHSTPPRGYTRIYILPTVLASGIFGDIPVASDVALIKNNGAPLLVGMVEKNKFLAFDIPSGGPYTIQVTPFIPSDLPSVITSYFPDGKTIVIQPLTAGNGAEFGLLGVAGAAIANGGKPQFQFVDVAQGLLLIQSMDLVALVPSAHEFLRQGATEISP